MTTQPSNDNPCDPVRQAERQARLDELYLKSGRAEPGHPMASLYTGLFQEMSGDAADAGQP